MENRRGKRSRNSRAGLHIEPKHENSISALISEAGIYYQVYDGVSEVAYSGSKPVTDKSLSKKQGLRRSLLRAGKPFSTLPVMIRETGRTHKRFIEDDDATLVNKKSRHNSYSHGPVKQIVKDGKEVDNGNK